MNPQKTLGEQEAFARLAALCSQAEHCRHEMAEKMRRWGLSGEQRDRVLCRLEAGRYVDDRRFARAFIYDKIRYNRWGRRKVEQALWQKHIEEAVYQPILDEVDDEEYLQTLRPLILSKRKQTRADSPYQLNTKLIRFALGRGFTMDLIRQVIDTDGQEPFDDEESFAP